MVCPPPTGVWYRGDVGLSRCDIRGTRPGRQPAAARVCGESQFSLSQYRSSRPTRTARDSEPRLRTIVAF
jgi:hypothetical protein